MSASLLLQYLLIALAVLVSVWVVLKKQFPSSVRWLRGALARVLLRPGCPAWLQSLGRAIAPPPTVGAGTCGGCDNCGPAPPRRH